MGRGRDEIRIQILVLSKDITKEYQIGPKF